VGFFAPEKSARHALYNVALGPAKAGPGAAPREKLRRSPATSRPLQKLRKVKRIDVERGRSALKQTRRPSGAYQKKAKWSRHESDLRRSILRKKWTKKEPSPLVRKSIMSRSKKMKRRICLWWRREGDTCGLRRRRRYLRTRPPLSGLALHTKGI